MLRTSSDPAQELTALETEAIRVLNSEAETFPARATLVERLRLAADRQTCTSSNRAAARRHCK